ncbi:TNF receptor-associated factor 6-like [Lineus longissimus]|uniref:TNF receptor-associated factor 6-like n=1 Tax=Lineus longissimus TaxID=88925 RepID=UPI002B4D633E
MESKKCACQASESSSDEEVVDSIVVAHTPGVSISPTHPRDALSLEGFNNDFVPPLDTKHQCQICMLALREPYQTQCGHRFCHSCILRWIRQRPTCPMDNKTLTEDMLYPDNFAKREIFLLKVRCKNKSRGCSSVMELNYYEDHQPVCPYGLIPCPLGCGMDVKVKDVEKHEKYMCVLRRYECNECGDQLTYQKVGEHQNTCPKSKIPCRFCQVIMTRDKLDHHQRKECPEVLTKCTFASYGCDIVEKRKSLDNHIEKSTNKHLELLNQFILNHGLFWESGTHGLDDFTPRCHENSLSRNAAQRRPASLDFTQGRRGDSTQDVSRQESDVYAGSDPGPMASGSSDYGSCSYREGFNSHGAILDKCGSISYPPAGHEAQAKIKSLQQQVVEQGQVIVELQGKVLQQQNLKDELVRMQSKLEQVEERVCNGQYIWRIDQYSKLIEDATKGKMTVIHSKGFYTSIYGYKVCLRINLNNKGTYLSIFVHLMQGDYDDFLDWPFSGKISLRVLDQNTLIRERKPVTETFVAGPQLAAFQRPTSARNHKGFGYMEFIPLGVIRDGTYIKDDTLVIKAEISEHRPTE